MARPCPAARLWETFVKPACGCGECDGMPPSTDPFYAGLGQAVRMGTELLAALIVGGGLGWLADTYLFASAPWGVVTGLVLGAVAGVLNAYRAAQRWK
jgi:ATP synthase protein I